MKLVYFAWVRERIGRAEETVTLPVDITVVDELVDWLRTRGEEYARYQRDTPMFFPWFPKHSREDA